MTAETGAFAGQLLRRGDPVYEAARVDGVFNARRPDRYPEVILRAADERDVQRGVLLARREGLHVSVRSGGHSWAGWSVRDGSILIDLAGLRDIEYDTATGIAAVRPAVQGGAELTPFLSARGRIFPGGHCDTVGLGGFLLQGGQGWNSRRWGWACEHVTAIDVVTATGELIHADETHDSDLLWAARGAGPGFFGVVTRFFLRTYPSPAAMTHDTWVWDRGEAGELVRWLQGVLPTLDPVVEPVVAVTGLDVPLAPGVRRPDGHVLLLHTTALCDTVEEAATVLAPFDRCPLADRAVFHERGLTTMAAEAAAQSAQNPPGQRYAADSQWSNATPEVLVPLLEELWGGLPSEQSFAIWYGWAPSRPLPDMAFSLEANVYLATYLIWADPADDERHGAWLTEQTRRLAAVGEGVYVGDSDFSRRPDRFMSDDHFARLEAVRARRDPDGLFCSYTGSPVNVAVDRSAAAECRSGVARWA